MDTLLLPSNWRICTFAKFRGKTVVLTIGQEYYNELMETDYIVYRDTIRNMVLITDFGESIYKCGTDTVNWLLIIIKYSK